MVTLGCRAVKPAMPACWKASWNDEPSPFSVALASCWLAGVVLPLLPVSVLVFFELLHATPVSASVSPRAAAPILRAGRPEAPRSEWDRPGTSRPGVGVRFSFMLRVTVRNLGVARKVPG